MTNWQNYPKTELHLHLEGAAPVDFITQQARKSGIDLSHVVDGERYLWKDFNDFLNVYEDVMRVLQTPEDFAELTKAVLNFQADHGVKYTEMTLGVILMCNNDPVRWDEMLAAIDQAADQMQTQRGIIANYTAVIVRHFGEEIAQKSAEIAAASKSKRVTGFGMAGDENHGRPSDFSSAFAIAGGAGLGLTCHAGEWAGPEAIRETIQALNVTRLGHGIRSAEDPELIELLVERDIHLEVNPGSNVSLGAATDWDTHPIHKLRDAGVSLSISTDDPPYFDTTMTREYDELAVRGWTVADFNQTNREAMRHAFCDPKIRKQLLPIWGGSC